jgi:hypothetical protein
MVCVRPTSYCKMTIKGQRLFKCRQGRRGAVYDEPHQRRAALEKILIKFGVTRTLGDGAQGDRALEGYVQVLSRAAERNRVCCSEDEGHIGDVEPGVGTAVLP